MADADEQASGALFPLEKWNRPEDFQPEGVYAGEGDNPDAPDAIVWRARAYLSRMRHAVQGEHGHGRLYAAAVVLVHGFRLSIDQAFDVLVEDWNPRCEPPWEGGELDRDFNRALRNAANKPHKQPRGWIVDRQTLGAGHGR